MKDFDGSAKINYNSKWPYICYYSYRILIISDSGLRETNVLLKFMDHQPNIDKIYLHVKDHMNQSINY